MFAFGILCSLRQHTCSWWEPATTTLLNSLQNTEQSSQRQWQGALQSRLFHATWFHHIYTPIGSCSALATTPNNNSWLRVWSKITLSSNVIDWQTIDDIGRTVLWNNGRPTTTYKRHTKPARVGQLNTSQITSQTSGPRFLANVHTAIRLGVFWDTVPPPP